ncbi:hypothetical protein BH10PSE4_BH10PSE4_11210 [soil metagenome]
MKILLAALLALTLTACATAPANVVLGSDAPDGLVVFEVATQGPAATTFYQIEGAAYDSAQSRIEGSGYFLMGAGGAPGKPSARYAVARAKPGTYVLTAISHMGTWYDCFNGDTIAFDVTPGAVTFLGELDARPALADIALKLPSYSMNSQKFYVLDTPRPAVTPPSALPDWTSDLAVYLKANFPQVSAPLKAATFQPAKFESGRSLFGEKVCYGYFNRAKDDPKPRPAK